MLIIPFVTDKGKFLNAILRLKTPQKKEGTEIDFVGESEILVGNKKLSNSTYDVPAKPNTLVAFIRNSYIASSKYNEDKFYVTTRTNSDTKLYDTYIIDFPPKKITDGLDNLYGSVINDMRKEIPGIKRGRYLDLADLGIIDHITDEKLTKLRKLRSEKNWQSKVYDNELIDLIETLNFIDMFDCTIIEGSMLDEERINELQNFFHPTYSRDSRYLNNYYKTAHANKSVYKKLRSLYNLVHDSKFNWIKLSNSSEKTKLKVLEPLLSNKLDKAS